jgi:hypothetical protein
VHGNTVLATTVDGLYRSTDRGESWSRSSVELPGDVRAGWLAASGGRYFLAGSSVIYLSTDEGASWSPAGRELPSNFSISSISAVAGTVVISGPGDRGSRVFRLDGEEWVELSDRLPSGISFTRFFDAGDRILGGTWFKGVWKGTFSTPSGVPSETEGSIAALPNPFSKRITIGFTLKHRSDVTLTLTAIDGEVVSTQSASLEAGARHLTIEAEGLPAGTYIYRLKGSDEVRGGVVVKSE